jgi:glucose-6-phosphate dehydrogenase assembly protein OpcA
MKLYTVGNFVEAWSNPMNHQRIAKVFDTPEQAQHAAAVCAGWLGARMTFTPMQLPVTGWWSSDDHAAAA